MAKPYFPISYAAILLEFIEAKGYDGESLFDSSEISKSQLDQPEAVISDQQFRELLLKASQILREPALGLYFGQKLTLTSHGALGYALMSCKSLMDAINILMKYYRLLINTGLLSIERTDTAIVIEHKNLGDNLISKNFDEEIFSAGVVTALKQLLHKDKLPMQIYFSYSEPNHKNAYEDVFGCKPTFDHHRNAIHLPLELMDAKPEFANPSMLKIYQQQCDKLLSRLDDKSDLSASVRRILISTQGDFPNLDKVAKHFHMSTRTFRRRLQDEETSFQQLSDTIKRELAEDYLRNPSFSIDTVASMVGFNDISNFRRAFIRWTGVSPATFQKQQHRQQ